MVSSRVLARQLLRARDDADTSCGAGDAVDDHMGLRIASVFIILIGGSFGALFPIFARNIRAFAQRPAIFAFAKYFGSGVIIGTAFIHLLEPAVDELSSPCLSEAWGVYPYAFALCLLSIFGIFIVELVAFRWGTAKLAALGIRHDAHGHGLGGHAAHGPEGAGMPANRPSNSDLALDVEKADPKVQGQVGPSAHFQANPDLHNHSHSHNHGSGHLGDSALAQLVGIAILEFGVLLHSVLIGLTLAVTGSDEFVVLFVVIIFHQTFEGLGLGSRLAYVQLPNKYAKLGPYVAALIFGVATPVGIAVGLGIKNTYAPESATASIVSGVLDALSAGILIYTGLVELLAHEFLFNKEMLHASNGKLTFAIGSMLLGCGLMALLGRWA